MELLMRPFLQLPAPLFRTLRFDGEGATEDATEGMRYAAAHLRLRIRSEDAK